MAHNTECANNGGLWRGEECGGCIWVYDHLVTHPRVVIASTSQRPCEQLPTPGRGAEVNVFSFMSGEYHHHHHHHHCTALHILTHTTNNKDGMHLYICSSPYLDIVLL